MTHNPEYRMVYVLRAATIGCYLLCLTAFVAFISSPFWVPQTGTRWPVTPTTDGATLEVHERVYCEVLNEYRLIREELRVIRESIKIILTHGLPDQPTQPLDP